MIGAKGMFFERKKKIKTTLQGVDGTASGTVSSRRGLNDEN